MTLESISKKDLTLEYVRARLVYEVTNRKQKESIGEKSTLFIRPSEGSASFQYNPSLIHVTFIKKSCNFARNYFKIKREKNFKNKKKMPIMLLETIKDKTLCL